MKKNTQSQVDLTCDIVSDLLPLYYDEVVSEETREAVSRHLATCEKCLREYHILKEELPETVNSGETEKKEKRINVFLREVSRRGVLKGVLITIMAVVIMLGTGYVLINVPLIPASAKDVSIEYVFEEEGNFFLVYKSPAYKSPTALYTKYDGDKVVLEYKIPIIHFVSKDGNDRGESEMSILTLEKENMEEQGCNPESILYLGKEIYSMRDGNVQKETPEYVKVYFEYSRNESGFGTTTDEDGIELFRIEDEDSDEMITSGRKRWDWEGNLLYDSENEE